MKIRTLNKLWLLLMSICFATGTGIRAQSLWNDINPYSDGASLREGSVLKVAVNEPFILEYEYINGGDENTSISMKPDRKLTEFLPPVESERSIVSKTKKNIRTRSRLIFQMAVRVMEIENTDTIRIMGTRRIARESGDSELTIRMEGIVNRKDIDKNGSLDSRSIADMVMEIQGLPEKKSRQLKMKRVPGDEEGTTKPSAEMSEEERQQLLLEYINRILGESRDL